MQPRAVRRAGNDRDHRRNGATAASTIVFAAARQGNRRIMNAAAHDRAEVVDERANLAIYAALRTL